MQRPSLDDLAHFLYEPALMGSRCKAVPKWKEPLHRIHLIPAWLLEMACDRQDRKLGMKEKEMRMTCRDE